MQKIFPISTGAKNNYKDFCFSSSTSYCYKDREKAFNLVSEYIGKSTNTYKMKSRRFARVEELDKESVYRHVYWDMFPKAGGSQIHPHIHMTSNSQGFHGITISLFL